jgi:hypothetical protein
MAFPAVMEWEFRATGGSNNNGGAFRAGAPGIDRSQQDSPHIVYTDLVIDAVDNTKVSSAANPFTTNETGNVINVTSGTGFTLGRYHIVSQTGGVATLDRAVGTVGSTGGNANLGGALALLTDALLEDTVVFVAGQTLWIKDDGTMTLTGNIDLLNDGTIGNPFFVIGYNTTHGDYPLGGDRPIIAAGANDTQFGDNWILLNLDVTTTSNDGLLVGTGGQIINCKSFNSSGSSDRTASSLNRRAAVIGCELVCTNGRGVEFANFTLAQTVDHCYIHDSVVGAWVGTSTEELSINNCIIDTCTTGFLLSTTGLNGFNIYNCTIYNCTTGINLSDAWHCNVQNNILDANGTGISQSAERKSNVYLNNCFDNTIDRTNVTEGYNEVSGDPGLNDPANADFTLTSGSNCIGAAIQNGTNTGAVGEYNNNIGVDQTNPDAAGGGGLLNNARLIS